MNKFNFKRAAKGVSTSLSKHSPEILTGIGIAGMITTTVLAVKATPKALDLIEQKKEELEVDKLTPVEVVKTCWKPYTPAAVTCVFSVACLIGANSVNAKRNAALATAYKISETALTEYREKVLDIGGEEQVKEVRDKISKKQIEETPVSTNEVIITKGETLCLDPLSKRYFKSDIERIKKAENELNKQMIHDMFGYVSVNEFYDEIGLDHTDIGDDLGWNVNNLIDIDFSAQIADNGEPCVVLNYRVAPRYDFSRF